MDNEKLNEAFDEGNGCDEIEDDLFMSADQFMGLDLPKQRMFLDPLVRENTLGFITAKPGVGKTWFALSLLKSLASGVSLFPEWTVKESVPVGFLDGEMPPNYMQERLCAMKMRGLGDRFFLLSNGLHNKAEYNLFNQCYLDGIKKQCLALGIKVLVVDNLVSLTGGMMDENTTQGYGSVNQWLLSMRNSGVSVIMVHHHGKGDKQRGTSSMIDNLDWHVSLHGGTDRLTVVMEKWRYKPVDSLVGRKFEMMIDQDRGIYWADGASGKGLADSSINVLKLLSKEGMKQVEIANELGVSASTVSKMKKRLIADGYFTEENQITERGKGLVEMG